MKIFIFTFFIINLIFASDQTNFECGLKSKCSQMKSCKEAYFYLQECGVTKLDRDKDGIPCERLCK